MECGIGGVSGVLLGGCSGSSSPGLAGLVRVWWFGMVPCAGPIRPSAGPLYSPLSPEPWLVQEGGALKIKRVPTCIGYQAFVAWLVLSIQLVV